MAPARAAALPLLRSMLLLVVLVALGPVAAYKPACPPRGNSDIEEIHHAIKAGFTNCTEVVAAYLARASAYGALNALFTVQRASALARAAFLDAHFKTTGKLKGKLHCIPTVIKDNMDVAGLPTTAGAAALASSVPLRDGGIWVRLKSAGAVLIAKANMAEFAEGWPIGPPYASSGLTSSSETGGTVVNAYGAPGIGNFTADGSSGGTGVAIGAALAVVGMGSDTCGSIQGPASASNIFGIRPPMGSVPDDGELPSFYKQDSAGPMARRVRDGITAWEALGYGVLAPGQLDTVLNRRNLKGYRFCYYNLFEHVPQPPPPGPLASFLVEPEVLALTNRAIEILQGAGAQVTRAFPADPAAALAFMQAHIYSRFVALTAARNTCIAACEAWSWDTYFSSAARFGRSAPYRSAAQLAASPLLPATYKARLYEALNNTQRLTPRAYCLKKCGDARFDELRQELVAFLKSWMKSVGGCQMLISPMWSFFPFNQSNLATPLEFGAGWISPYAGWPAVVVPMGFSAPSTAAPKGLPIGLDIMGPSEAFFEMLSTAVVFQDRLDTVTLPPATPPLLPQPRMGTLFNCSSR